MPRPLRLLQFLVLAACVLAGAACADAPPSNAIAIAVVFDTSGSMRDPMPTGASEEMDTKYRIAQRAFQSVIERLETFAAAPGASPLRVGVFIFNDGNASTAVPLKTFDAGALRDWLTTMKPGGSTPLGDTLYLAGSELLKTSAAARHLLVLTDGANTKGRTAISALETISAAADRQQTPVFTHVIALDIKPSVFAALEQHGATLIGAVDGAQLAAQFDFILEEKILVEAPR